MRTAARHQTASLMTTIRWKLNRLGFSGASGLTFQIIRGDGWLPLLVLVNNHFQTFTFSVKHQKYSASEHQNAPSLIRKKKKKLSRCSGLGCRKLQIEDEDATFFLHMISTWAEKQKRKKTSGFWRAETTTMCFVTKPQIDTSSERQEVTSQTPRRAEAAPLVWAEAQVGFRPTRKGRSRHVERKTDSSSKDEKCLPLCIRPISELNEFPFFLKPTLVVMRMEGKYPLCLGDVQFFFTSKRTITDLCWSKTLQNWKWRKKKIRKEIQAGREDGRNLLILKHANPAVQKNQCGVLSGFSQKPQSSDEYSEEWS